MAAAAADAVVDSSAVAWVVDAVAADLAELATTSGTTTVRPRTTAFQVVISPIEVTLDVDVAVWVRVRVVAVSVATAWASTARHALVAAVA